MRLGRFLCSLLLAVSIFTASCRTAEEPVQPVSTAQYEDYSYRVPEQLDDFWLPAEIDPQVLSIPTLERGINAVNRGEYPEIHSMLIAHRGRLVFEKYFTGHNWFGERIEYNYAIPNRVASLTKGITGLVVGIAVDNGHIKNLDAPALDWYPEYTRRDRIEKEKITIENLLTMESGLE